MCCRGASGLGVLQTTTADQLLEFFKQVGDVKFVRMAGDETQPTRFAFVEFLDQNSVSRALTFNGVMFGDRPLKYGSSLTFPHPYWLISNSDD